MKEMSLKFIKGLHILREYKIPGRDCTHNSGIIYFIVMNRNKQKILHILEYHILKQNIKNNK